MLALSRAAKEWANCGLLHAGSPGADLHRGFPSEPFPAVSPQLSPFLYPTYPRPPLLCPSGIEELLFTDPSQELAVSLRVQLLLLPISAGCSERGKLQIVLL